MLCYFEFHWYTLIYWLFMFCHVDRIDVDIGLVIYQQCWCIACLPSVPHLILEFLLATEICRMRARFLILQQSTGSIVRYFPTGSMVINIIRSPGESYSMALLIRGKKVVRRSTTYQAPQPRRVPLWGAGFLKVGYPKMANPIENSDDQIGVPPCHFLWLSESYDVVYWLVVMWLVGQWCVV